MAMRFEDALAISQGACNPLGITHTLKAAYDEIKAEPTFNGTASITGDPAVRVILHQLAFICSMGDGSMSDSYNEAYLACVARAKAEADAGTNVRKVPAWSGSPSPDDPDNVWIDDATGERVDAHTGQRTPAIKGVILTDHDLVDLLGHVMLLAGSKGKTGTYNQADPTAWCRLEGWATFDHDPLWVHSEERPGEQGPWPMSYHVELHDVTWGVELSFTDEDDKEVLLGEGGHYMDHSEKKWARGDTRKLRDFLLALVTDAEWSTKKPPVMDDDGFDYAAAERAAGWDATP